MWDGKRIAQRRVQLHMSQEELAAAVGTNQKQISRYENNVNSPTGEVLISLAKALETTADWLLGLNNDPARPLRSSNDLADDEIELVRIYRQKDAEKRGQLLQVARVL